MYPGLYVGDYYIRFCSFSTPANIKTTAASIKKFAKSTYDHGFIHDRTYQSCLKEIKEERPRWQLACKRYNDPDDELSEQDIHDLFFWYV